MKLVVTGASGALGSVTATLLERAGHDVQRIVRNVLADAPFNVIGCSDLAEGDAAEEALAEATARLGGLDGVIHLAGDFVWKPVVESDIQLWRSMFRTNFETTLKVVQAALKFLASDGGIVTVGAVGAMPSGAGLGPYGASKSAVTCLTQSLAAEIGKGGVRINTLLPAIIDTPANRAAMPNVDPATWTTPDAIAQAIEFLVSPSARSIHGALIPVTNAAN